MWCKLGVAKIITLLQDSPIYPSRSGEKGGKIVNRWQGHHTLENLPVLVPPSFDRPARLTDSDPQQCQPCAVHGVRIVLNYADGELSYQPQAQDPEQGWKPRQLLCRTFLAGTAQFSSALTEEDSGDLSHRLVTDLD